MNLTGSLRAGFRIAYHKTLKGQTSREGNKPRSTLILCAGTPDGSSTQPSRVRVPSDGYLLRVTGGKGGGGG